MRRAWIHTPGYRRQRDVTRVVPLVNDEMLVKLRRNEELKATAWAAIQRQYLELFGTLLLLVFTVPDIVSHGRGSVGGRLKAACG
jgi:hypothetical protein